MPDKPTPEQDPITSKSYAAHYVIATIILIIMGVPYAVALGSEHVDFVDTDGNSLYLLANDGTLPFDEDAFDVVIPSLPGYGFSGKPTAIGWHPHEKDEHGTAHILVPELEEQRANQICDTCPVGALSIAIPVTHA